MEGNVTPPQKISGEPPVYTEAARKARVQGSVIVETIIDEHGDVTKVRVLQGLPMGLDQSAVEAVQTWKFKPSTLEGRPVKVYYVLTVNFKIEGPLTHGPLFRKFLEENAGFAGFLAAHRYQDAAELLDRQAAERTWAETVLARCYLLLEQGRLKEAWQKAQSYSGPDPFELPYAVGLFAWEKFSSDKVLSPEARAEILELGLQAETQAMAARKDALTPVLQKGLFLREKAKLTSDPEERKALAAELKQLQELALELYRRGASAMDPFAQAKAPGGV